MDTEASRRAAATFDESESGRKVTEADAPLLHP
jgi:hypothetical protein